MTVETSDISLEKVIQLKAALDTAGISTETLIGIFESDDPVANFAEELGEQPVFPFQWKQSNLYRFRYCGSDKEQPVSVTITVHTGEKLTYTDCPDCNLHAWVTFRGETHKWSKRMQGFVQISPTLQLIAKGGGIYLRWPQPYKHNPGCLGAAD